MRWYLKQHVGTTNKTALPGASPSPALGKWSLSLSYFAAVNSDAIFDLGIFVSKSLESHLFSHVFVMNQVLQWPGPPEDTWMPMRVLMAFASCVVRWPKLTARVGLKKHGRITPPETMTYLKPLGMQDEFLEGCNLARCELSTLPRFNIDPRPFSMLSELGINKFGFRFQPFKVEKSGICRLGTIKNSPTSWTNQLNWWTSDGRTPTFWVLRRSNTGESSHHRSTISYINELIHRRLWAMTRDTQQGEWQMIYLCKMYRKNPSGVCTPIANRMKWQKAKQ